MEKGIFTFATVCNTILFSRETTLFFFGKALVASKQFHWAKEVNKLLKTHFQGVAWQVVNRENSLIEELKENK